MKRLSSTDQNSRFKGGTRYFHNPKARRSSWDQWVDAGAKPSSPVAKWLVFLSITVLVALVGIVVGLYFVLSRN